MSTIIVIPACSTSTSPDQTSDLRVTRGVARPRVFPALGVLLATTLTVAACSAGTPRPPATATPAGTGASAPAGSPSTTAAPADQAGFASALTAWNAAAAAPAATRNTYLQQAADALRATGNSGYDDATNELTYLANLPATNNTAAQQANAHSDALALDSFFGTPGLMS